MYFVITVIMTIISKCIRNHYACLALCNSTRDVPDFGSGSGRSGIRPFIGSPAPVRIMAGFGPAVLGPYRVELVTHETHFSHLTHCASDFALCCVFRVNMIVDYAIAM